MFSCVLVANRGEIACRIIRGCHELGVETVGVYSEADAHALHVRLAGRARCLGPASPGESYLHQAKLLGIARECGCDAVHPGYGFLAENADFAQAVQDAGLAWIGPPPSAMRAMGIKTAARAAALSVGVPCIPGFDDTKADDAAFMQAANEIGYPVLVKASAGGGGKGMRSVASPGALPAALAAARREAGAAFGDPGIYLERLIEQPRHIEIQLLADNHGSCVHFGERECSIQRRHQKVVEEAPSTTVPPQLRSQLGQAAVAIAQQVGYTNAGTVEFIVDASGRHYFLEMNTRLQVEHPVTEMCYGVDLVHWQLRLAAGEHLELAQKQLVPRGHAIEVRIYAEDPAANYLPQTGKVEVLGLPCAPGVRFDSLLYPGCEITADYDPLLGKLIAWAEDRTGAIARLSGALGELRILGLTSNIPFLREVVAHPAFAAGATDTGFLERHFTQWRMPDMAPPAQVAAALALALKQPQRTVGPHPAAQAVPWQYYGGWSNV